jgi:multidrug efflux pump subunit AcrA (membrane-fusion protein)
MDLGSLGKGTAMKSGPRRWIGAMVLIVLFGGTLIGLAKLRPEVESWVPVERHDLVVGVDVEGELRALESAQLGPPPIPDVWDFRISQMAPEGSEVKQGQPVLSFDTTELQRQLQEKITERDSAEKNLEKRVTDLEIELRDHSLRIAEAQAALRKASLKLKVPEAVVSRSELDKARIENQIAELSVRSLQDGKRFLEALGAAEVAALREARNRASARVRELEANLEKMTVRAPRAGSVIHITDWRNEKKKVGDRVWRAGKVMEIPNLEVLLGDGHVAEADAGRIRVGQPVSLRLDAYPDQKYAGTVNTIRRAVQRKRRSPERIVKLEIALAETDIERMRPGMRFRGSIEVLRVNHTLVVPHEAIFPRPGGAVVVRRTLFGRRQVSPSFGHHNKDAFAVIAGLKEGDRLLVRGEQKDEGGQ